MGVPRLVHWTFVGDLILDSKVDTCVLLGRRSSSCDQDLVWRERNRGRTLVELGSVAIIELLYGPLVLIDIVTERDLGVNVVAKEVDLGLVLSAL